MNIPDMFAKPEIPVEVKIPEDLSDLLARHNVSASKALKLAVYALLMAEQNKECDIADLLGKTNVSAVIMKRMTVRLPILVYDTLTEKIQGMSVGSALTRISFMYLNNDEALAYV